MGERLRLKRWERARRREPVGHIKGLYSVLKAMVEV